MGKNANRAALQAERAKREPEAGPDQPGGGVP
jgi:hypothetical protein